MRLVEARQRSRPYFVPNLNRGYQPSFTPQAFMFEYVDEIQAYLMDKSIAFELPHSMANVIKK